MYFRKTEKGMISEMKLLMHTCCAPCNVYCIETLRNEGIEPTVYWYNPNIHPYMEYKARRDCLKAVSYTHLDVYKRQVFYHLISAQQKHL